MAEDKTTRPAGVEARVYEDFADLAETREDWDRLAEQTAAPFGAPDWVEAWWRHLAPPRAELAVIAVRRDDALIGVAPFYAVRRLGLTELRLLSGGWASRLGVLAKAHDENEVARAIDDALRTSRLRPDVIHWEGIDARSSAPSRLVGTASRRIYPVAEDGSLTAPVINLGYDSFEDWLATRPRKFRKEMRRVRGKAGQNGAVFRLSDSQSLERDLEAFGRLHVMRRANRGGTTALPPNALAALVEFGVAGIEDGRFRLQMIDGPGGEAISADVCVAAGGWVACWNGGFDERWGRFSPGSLSVLAVVEDAFQRGDRTVDLGGGESDYKWRFADEDLPIAWRTSFRASGVRYPVARLSRLPNSMARRAARVMRQRIGHEHIDRVLARFRPSAR